MKYQSTNPEVRHIIERYRWHEWVDYEIEHINNQLDAEAKHNHHTGVGYSVFARLEPMHDNPLLYMTQQQVDRWSEYVRRQRTIPDAHEISDLVDVLAELLPLPYHRYLHRHFTSSNVIDSCNHRRWNKLLLLLDSSLDTFYSTGIAHCDIITVPGMTHGLHAYRTSLRHRFLSSTGHIRHRGHIRDKLFLPETVTGGPTGYGQLDANQRDHDHNGTHHRQAYQRSEYWRMWCHLATCVAECEQLATDYRFYCSDLGWQVGIRGSCQGTTSSSMPGKHNPSALERVCSVSHLVRSMVASQIMLPAQWMDRDLVHSAHERETIDRIWDGTFFCVEEMTRIMADTVLDAYEPVSHNSHDELNELLGKGLSYKAAREGAKEFPTG